MQYFNKNKSCYFIRFFLETELVLRYSYKFEKTQIIHSFRKLLNLPNVFVENLQVIENTLNWAEQGLDFPDALHLAKSQHTSVLLTFDKKFIKRSQNLGVCQVKQPL
jgi:predicted nucleic-acid-binding protein